MAERRALLVGIKKYEHALELQGCHNDAAAMRCVLTRAPFDFPDANVQMLRDPGRDELVAAMEALLEAAGRDDVVVFYYSGHGSWLKDPRAGERYETLVPRDSGRGPHENLDLFDKEIDLWVRRLNDKTDNVTLVFDCCHSGGVTRADDPIRQTDGDEDPKEALLSRVRGLAGRLRHPEQASGDGLDLPGSPEDWARWASRPRQSVVLAACRDAELAGEHNADRSGLAEGFTPPDPGGFSTCFGAFTFFLHLALATLGQGDGRVAWGDVMRKVSSRVRGARRRQHPLLVGPAERTVFGLDELPRNPYLRIVSVDGARAVLSGGAAHGVRVGSRWEVRTRSAEDRQGGTRVARVEVEEVRATTSVARAGGPEEAAALRPTQRAFLESQPAFSPGLRVRLEGAGALAERIAASPLLEVAADGGHDVVVRRAEREATWVAVDRQGALAVHARPADDEGAEAILDDLEGLARFEALLALEPPPESPLNGKVSLAVGPVRPWDEPFEAAEREGGLLLFNEGEEAEILIAYDPGEVTLPEEVRVHLAQLDSDRSVQLLMPSRRMTSRRPQGVRLRAGEPLRFPGGYWGRRAQGRGGKQEVPEGFPWWVEGDRKEISFYTLKLFVTLREADFSFLEQEATRGDDDHPAVALAAARFTGRGGPREEVVPAEAWTVVDLEVGVCR